MSDPREVFIKEIQENMQKQLDWLANLQKRPTFVVLPPSTQNSVFLIEMYTKMANLALIQGDQSHREATMEDARRQEVMRAYEIKQGIPRGFMSKPPTKDPVD